MNEERLPLGSSWSPLAAAALSSGSSRALFGAGWPSCPA